MEIKKVNDIIIHINNKEVKFKDIMDCINKIYLITTDSCKYCKENNINTDKDKIKLIRKIIEKTLKIDGD